MPHCLFAVDFFGTPITTTPFVVRKWHSATLAATLFIFDNSILQFSSSSSPSVVQSLPFSLRFQRSQTRRLLIVLHVDRQAMLFRVTWIS
ncbi:hypothetical protein RJ641_001311 [Dillenia turbinata]|uniref:Uncharacterized protein n=1 Tax=Dillenia turbinata TaxID=194707 RepID=A0AAN8ZV02_9MAGN